VRASIIGAGFAGLAAAEALGSAGIDVEVFEARDRIGGRVWSQTLPGGAVIERGAEFILDDYDTSRELARRLRTPLAPTGMAYGDREPRGGPAVQRAELIRVAGLLTGLARGNADGPGMALGDLLGATSMSPGVRAALEARLSISAAHEAGELPGTWPPIPLRPSPRARVRGLREATRGLPKRWRKDSPLRFVPVIPSGVWNGPVDPQR